MAEQKFTGAASDCIAPMWRPYLLLTESADGGIPASPVEAMPGQLYATSEEAMQAAIAVANERVDVIGFSARRVEV